MRVAAAFDITSALHCGCLFLCGFILMQRPSSACACGICQWHHVSLPCRHHGSYMSLSAWSRAMQCGCRAKGIPGVYQGFSMGLASSCAGAGIGFATYEALTVAYRKRMGYAPMPSERGAIAGAARSCYPALNSFSLHSQGPWCLGIGMPVSSGPPLPALLCKSQNQSCAGPCIYLGTGPCPHPCSQRGFHSRLSCKVMLMGLTAQRQTARVLREGGVLVPGGAAMITMSLGMPLEVGACHLSHYSKHHLLPCSM